ncbi:hypothetical protein BGX28_005387 [Mortierella sp. GBA30]|nr:hypothetical protein BGX28_005387 [Mortierella sp. GBA30]
MLPQEDKIAFFPSLLRSTMTEFSSSGYRRRLKYGILITIAILGSGQLFYYYIWSGRLSTTFIHSSLDSVQYPLDLVESDRACELLDRPFLAATLPDYTQTNIKRWTECQRLNTTQGWIVDHCTVPGSNPTGATQDESQCYPGGYFRIQRTQVASETESTCRLKPNITLAQDSATNIYATSFLGPDTFRVVLVGPERLSFMQQQPLGNCTYAIPYLISRPGRFWVQKILHTYEGYDALNENKPKDWWPEYLGNDILDISSQQQQRGRNNEYYHFDVCSHCIPWVAMDEAQGLGGVKDICSRVANKQSRQYGTYSARMPIESVQQAIGHPYEWIPVRPRCMFHPTLSSFEPAIDSDDENVRAQKTEALQCLQKKRSLYFVGDAHMRTLFSGVLQRLQGKPGAIERRIEDRSTHVLKAGNVQARLDFDAYLNNTLSRIPQALDQDIEDVSNVRVLDNVDTVIFGLGTYPASLGHWTTAQFTERISTVLGGLVRVRNARKLAYGGNTVDKRNDLKIIWIGIPAWMDSRDQGTRNSADWRTNHRTLYWNKLVEEMVERINVQHGNQNVVDKLSALAITIPFKSSNRELYTSETPVDSLCAELIHKLDLCA